MALVAAYRIPSFLVAAYRIPSYRRGDGTRYVPTVRTVRTVSIPSSPGVEPTSARSTAWVIPTKPARFSAEEDPVFIVYIQAYFIVYVNCGRK